jgi:hypothetical protein
MLMLVVGAVALWHGLAAWRTLIAFLPTLVLLGQFVAGRADPPVWVPLPDRLLALYAPLAIVDERAVVVSVLLASAFMAVGAVGILRRRSERGTSDADGLLAVLAGTVILVLLAPTAGSSGRFIGERLALYPYVLALFWFAATNLRPSWLGVLKSAAAVLAIAQLAVCWPRWIALSDYTAEYVTAADYIESGHSVLPLAYSQGGVAQGASMSVGFGPFLHVSGYLAARKVLVDLGLYEASTDHFPVRFRPERNPFVHISPLSEREREPPRAGFLDYPARTGGRVDYVVLWQPDVAPIDHPDVVSVRSQLNEAYQEVYVSPRRLVHVYRHRERSLP